ncbi:modification methylase [Staphylococcus delphini]|uniref:adenine-specific methyltransferase EcoRI family protein n=1 Tax=Staphylococcus delphini TaxID=53344 RepID=UPI001362516C|nr:adenine-specific methyltransferase EcoRI family protein [Staphylococcus delphini]NBK47763.1 modification methylase [Staphylococcus delphini]
MSLNSNLHKAKSAKSDEFYTQIADIENELKNYEKHFNDKHIFCNCDDPEFSNFWRYFALNFKRLNIKRLTSTHYSASNGKSYRMDMFKKVPKEYLDRQTFMTLEESGIELPLGYITKMESNGDFRSQESIDLLLECDIVATNPPFSLFGEYVSQLIEYNKKFIILGSQNALTTKQIFPLLKDNKMWAGVYAGNMKFRVPNRDEYKREGARFWIDDNGDYWRSLGNICWFTNLDHYKRHENIILYKRYNETDYPKYDNYNAINVDKISDIPEDYNGVMGVPVTYLYKHNPSQFDIVGQTHSADKSVEVESIRTSTSNRHRGMIDGVQKYARVLIRRI